MTEPTAPALWQHLVQWQPATAAALAQHIRALPDDWPLRVFGVGRTDAALTLPPGATGEQFPDRVPELAPYDEVAPLDDCPACQEAEGNCRFHEGYAAGHHEQSQVLRDAVKIRPDIGLREFMRWRADVEEAEDQGEEPPPLPAASAGVSPPPDRAELRARIAAAMRPHYHCIDNADPDADVPCRCGWIDPGPAATRETDWDAHIADVVLAVLPPPADRAAVLREVADAVAADRAETLARVMRTVPSDEAWASGNRHAEDLLRRLAAEAQQQPDTETPDDEPPTEEQIVRDHVTTLHLIGEQLAEVESWMWQHLAAVRDAAAEPCLCGHAERRHRRQRAGWTREACSDCPCDDYVAAIPVQPAAADTEEPRP